MLKKLMTTAALLVLVAACETAPGSEGGAAGSGSRFGDKGGVSGRASRDTVGEIAKNVPDRVFYAYDSSSLDEEGQATLRAQAEWLKANPNVKITVEGHCDERGTREYNLALGERRANAAKRFLVNLGVNGSRVTTISYGKERPAISGSEDASYAQNRRAVTVVN